MGHTGTSINLHTCRSAKESVLFDYIVVGGGSGGATLASRLSEDPACQVCLIEAGGEGRHLLIRAPAGVVALLPGRPKISNYAYQTVPQVGLHGRRGYQPRGKALGGSSAINAMLYVRGHHRDYDEWAALGCADWAFDDVLPYFKRAEHNQRGAGDWHGTHGPLQVSDQQTPRSITQAFIEAASHCGIARNHDFNGADQAGVGLYQVTQFHDDQRRGERCSAAAAYLEPHLARTNLTILTRTQACRIVLENRRAVGVEIDQGGQLQTLRARHEVALCGGAFNSPQLLMLSGIGDPKELAQHGIKVRHVLGGVGKNLQDHLDFTLSYTSQHQDLFGIGFRAGAQLVREMIRWRRSGTGMIATPFAEAGAFINSTPEQDRPDLQLHFVISMVDDHARRLHLGYGYSCHVCLLRPASRGVVGLYDADAFSAPKIDPRYLSDPQDAHRLLQGVKITQTIMRAPSLAGYRRREVYATEGLPDALLSEQIRARADTIYHPVGTCQMGTGADAVVDARLCVHGIDALRVVDASVMPRIIGGNTNAATIMIAERAAEWMRARLLKAAEVGRAQGPVPAAASPASAEPVLSA